VFHARPGLGLGRKEQHPSAVGARHRAEGVDGGEATGAGGGDEEVGGADGGSGHVEDEVGREAQVEEAHAEGLEHEALAAYPVKENAAVSRGNGGELGD